MKAELVRVEAGDGMELAGLYAVPPGGAARRAVLHTHGLAGNFYENRFLNDVCDAVVEKGLAFLVTNNRGHDYLADNLRGKEEQTEYSPGGATRELFEECVHDIGGGARFLAEQGHEGIYFEGHSLGCSKTVHYLASVGDPRAVGLMMISPPEMFGLQHVRSETPLEEMLPKARALVADGKGDTLLEVGRDAPYSAATFVSMYGDPSVTDIFPFRLGRDGDYGKLASIRLPVLVTYGDTDEAVTTTVEEAASLIEGMASGATSATSVIVRGANHVYWGHETELAMAIAGFVEP